MEAHTVAASLQRSREQIRAELFSAEDDGGPLAGLMPRSAIMGFLLAPERRGLVLATLGTVLALVGRGGVLQAAGVSGLSGMLWRLLGMALRRKN
jgi:hypothetical protein